MNSNISFNPHAYNSKTPLTQGQQENLRFGMSGKKSLKDTFTTSGRTLIEPFNFQMLPPEVQQHPAIHDAADAAFQKMEDLLIQAAGRGKKAMVKQILEKTTGRSKELGKNNRSMKEALVVATENGHVEVVKLLLSNLSHIPNVSQKFSGVAFAFFKALRKGHAEVGKILLPMIIADPIPHIKPEKTSIKVPSRKARSK